MKTRIKLLALIAGFLVMMPMTSAWASSTTYYAALKAQVSSTGGGKVYAGTSKTAGAYADTSMSEANSTTQNAEKTFYAFAQADTGFEFAGWSTSDGGTDLGTASPLEVKLSCNSTTSPNATTYYATFKKKVLDAFGITFEKSEAGTYTVDGAAPANKTGLTEATTVELASSDPNFLNWKVNGKDVVDNPYTATCIADTTISAVFLTADMVAEATTFDELTAALENKKKITIPAGIQIAIEKGSSVIVPKGKILVNEGTLFVEGTLSNSGSITGEGKISKCVRLFTQANKNGEWGPNAEPIYAWPSPKVVYWVTTMSSNVGSVSGVNGVASHIAFRNGKGDYIRNVLADSNVPNVVAYSVDNAIAMNHVKTFSATSKNGLNSEGTEALSGLKVLTGDVSYDTAENSASKYSHSWGLTDCAGNKLTTSKEHGGGTKFTVINGSVSFSGKVTGTDSTFVNCSSIKSTSFHSTKTYSVSYRLFDTTVTIGSTGVNASSMPTGGDGMAFYSGEYDVDFSKMAKSNVFAATNTVGTVFSGAFKNDPNNYLKDPTTYEAKQRTSDNYWEVRIKKPAEYVAVADGVEYADLAEAIAKSSSGNISLKQHIALEDTVTIPAEKSITIDLNGYNISGGSIENSGTLRLEDNCYQDVKGLFTTPVVNKKGTIDITYGQYGGKFTLEGGTLTTHGGTFTSTFSYEEKGGVANLRGGTFNGTISIPEGYELVSGTLGEKVKGVIICDNPLSSAGADASYTVRGLDPVDRGLGISDFDLYSNYKHNKSGWTTRSDFAGREALWDRLAELRSTVEPVESKAFEATMAFDRPVKAGSISGVASVAGRTETMELEDDVAADEDYHVFIPLVTGRGYYAISYKNMFNGEENDRWAKLMCGVKNNGSLENIGTTMTFKYQLRTQERAPGYTTQNPVYNYSFTTYASATYKFTGKGAIYGGTDYTSLAAAIAAVEKAGTILLSKDCTEEEEVVIGKEVSFTLDKNSFAFTGTIKAADGYVLVNNDNFYLITKKSEEDKDKTDEEVAEKVKEELQKPDEDVPALTKQEVQVLDNAVIDVKQEDAETKVPASIIKPPSDPTAQTAATLAIEETKIPAGSNWSFGLASVTVVDGKESIGEPVKVEKGDKSVPLAVDNENKDKGMEFDASKLQPGVYKKTITVDEHTMIDPNSDELVVQATELAKGEPIALPIPSESTLQGDGATLDKIIDPDTLENGDEVKYYNQRTGLYDAWKYKDGKWVSEPVIGNDGQEQQSVSSADLRIGTAAWFTRNSDNTAPVKVIGVRSGAELKTEIKEEGWSLLANPNPTEGFDLSTIEVTTGTDDGEGKASTKDQIVEVTGVARKTFTYDVNKKSWGYYERTVENGRYQRVWNDAATIGAGKPFWFVSGGGKPTIDWKKGAVKQEEAK